jgi:hypothetical protein
MDQSANTIIAGWAREACGTTTISGTSRDLLPEKCFEARGMMKRLCGLAGGGTVAMKLCFCDRDIVAAPTVDRTARAVWEGRSAE